MKKAILIVAIILVVAVALSIWYKSRDTKEAIVSQKLNQDAFEMRSASRPARPTYIEDVSSSIQQDVLRKL